MPAEAIIETHIDAVTKQKAEAIFAAEGLTIDQFLRDLLAKCVTYDTVPRGLFGYNAETMEAIQSARRGEFEGQGTIDDLFAELHAHE